MTYETTPTTAQRRAVATPTKGEMLSPAESGDRLVVDSKPHASGGPLFSVLCLWGGEYVVWTYSALTGGCSGGRYHRTLGEAVETFTEAG